jgi:hypothetical protein
MRSSLPVVVIFAMLLNGSPAAACTAETVVPGERVLNPFVESPNRQYCAEVHVWRGIGGCLDPTAAQRWNVD